MRNEFTYWYPMDLRVSGKDLITNHLTMMFFNHMAIFGPAEDLSRDDKLLRKAPPGPDLMPGMVYANGHILVNGEKMSKGKGNFITLSQAIERYGTDVTRFIAGCAGDDTTDGSFNDSEVDPTVLAMYAEIQNWAKNDLTLMRTGDYQFIDHLHLIHLNRILNQVDNAYREMKFRNIIKYGFYELQAIRNKYENPHQDVYKLFLQTELVAVSPIIPHWAEYMGTTHNIPIEWPLIKINPNYDNAKTEWLNHYCQIIQSKVGNRIKRFKNKFNYQSCKLTINKDVNELIEQIMKHDIMNKEQRKKLVAFYTDKATINSMIELFTHIDKLSDSFNKSDIAAWLLEDHSEIIKSYLSVCFPNLHFEIEYQASPNSDPLNPKIQFS